MFTSVFVHHNEMDLKNRISIFKGDITQIPADIIVNAANSSLMGGGGVDGAIHRAGGPKILEECKEIIARQGKCKTGEAVITTAGNLPAQYVIHTVGPVWNGGGHQEHQKLKNCYQNALQLASKYPIQAISFPNISTGAYGFPKEEAAKIGFNTVADFLKHHKTEMSVYFVCFDDESHRLYQQMYEHLEE